jgi:hypothetical protein
MNDLNQQLRDAFLAGGAWKRDNPGRDLIDEADRRYPVSAPDLNWKAAETRLREIRQAYVDAGRAGLLGLRGTLDPLMVRFERGERTAELHAAMMAVE